MRVTWMGCNWSMYQNLNTWAVFWMNQVQMMQSVKKKWQVGGKLQVLLVSWLVLGVCSLNVQGFCLCYCMVGERRRGLLLGLYRGQHQRFAG